MSIHEAATPPGAKSTIETLERAGGGFVEAVLATRMPMLMTDAQSVDNSVIFANAAFLKLLGLSAEEVIGNSYSSVITDRTASPYRAGTEDRLGSHVSSIHDFLLIAKDGRQVWISQIIDPIIENGRIVRHFASFYNIDERVLSEQQLRGEKDALERRINARTYRLEQATERMEEEASQRRRVEMLLRDTLMEKENEIRFSEFLLAELRHRTSNAFQLTSGMLTMQARHAGPEARAALDLAADRIIRVSDVHDLLTVPPLASGLIHLSTYLDHLCRHTVESLSADRFNIRLNVDEIIDWPSSVAVPIGLIVNEALINAIKHAFPDGRRGLLAVTLQVSHQDDFELRIEDDGVGMPMERRKGSLGLGLMQMAARQIKAEVSCEPGSGGRGTAIKVAFPRPETPVL